MANSNNPWEDDQSSKTNNSEKIVDFIKTPKNTPQKKKSNQEFNLNIKWFILGAILLWLGSGFYQVQTNENAVVLRFGSYVDTTNPGLHYHLPYPIEKVIKVSMTQERSFTLGENAQSTSSSFTESHMLTGDENIVDINLTVVYRIKNAQDYLFKMKQPDQTVRVATQSVLREIVGQSQMMPIISGDRGKVEDDTKIELQKVLDDFGSGVEIIRVRLQKADPPKQVVDAFNEVQRAKADMERYKNEAESYRNEVVPNAKGQASQILQSAEAYKEAVVNKAKGDAERFNSIYQAYKQGKDVTSKRLYIETMENILANSNKVIMDPSAKGSNVLPYLPLNSINSNKGAN